jgi:thiol-disulfide isomerase/thioredoxin
MILVRRLVMTLSLMCMVSAVGAAQSIPALSSPVEAPPLELQDLEGEVHQLDDYRGQVVAINFWATWCAPCRDELPSMQTTYEAFKDQGFVILGVNVGEDWDTVAPFLESFLIEFPILLAPDSTILDEWQVMGLPTTFFVDRQGNVTHRINGGRDWQHPEFRAQLRSIVTEQKAAATGM